MYKNSVLLLIFFVAEISGLQRTPGVRRDTRPNVQTATCDTSYIEHALRRLETITAENMDKMTTQLEESKQELRALHWNNNEMRKTMGRQRNGETRNDESSSKLDLEIDNLSKGLQLVVTTLKSLKSEVRRLEAKLADNGDARQDHLSSNPDGPDLRLPRNCKEVQQRGNNISGIYSIQPESSPKAFMVLCDMTTSGGGWTFIHNRYEGAQDFYLNWNSYKLGFGNLGGEFWLGLEYLHQLTGDEVNELLIQLVDMEGNQAHAYYDAFSVADEVEGYALKVLAGYQGDAGDSLIYHAGRKFSTKDVDQDEWAEGSCAQSHSGAWWYKSCDNSNLNGRYLGRDIPDEFVYRGMYWKDFGGPQKSLQRARMMVRPRGNLRATSSEFSEPLEVTMY